jgi:hypothetical protein
VVAQVDEAVSVPKTAWEIMDAKLSSLIHVTAQTDRRLEAMEFRREEDAKRLRQMDSISGRLAQAVMRFQIWQVTARAVPAVSILVAMAVGSFLGTVAVILALHVVDTRTAQARALNGSAGVPADAP